MSFWALLAAMAGLLPMLPLRWEKLPPIPDREGFAAPFAGVSHGALIVAGGANFPDKRPWDGGTKTWYDTIYILASPEKSWSVAGRLPRPNAYGVSVTFSDKLICIGGGDAAANFSAVCALSWDGHAVSTASLPPLPGPCGFMCGALVGTTVYVAGGMAAPNSVSALDVFWSLDLAGPGAGWHSLAPWPGPPRAQAVAAACSGEFYLFSGHDLHAGADGKPVRTYLSDAYAYAPGRGWRRLADLPHPAAAAPTPAPVSEEGRILILTGDDGKRLALNGPNHPGFQRDLLIYDCRSNRWETGGQVPFSRATVPAARWGDRWIVPNGEMRPGYRANEVWSLTIGRKP